ncbi:hypothetical protein PVL29_001030 [Vitis rotundifolia]|uniref:EXS domain-containing protein n=1 Tax=Vitis rotundifolia TaxID=103349 RepID=A0AA39E8L3_VITRO|nr:hypothetical protein PVL29_001030 [Vitis rotundifolia]
MQSKNYYLRDKLLVSHKSVYFAAMVLNILLRFAWLQSVLEFNACSLPKMTFSTMVSCLEILRRGIWSFFRYFALPEGTEVVALFLFHDHLKSQPVASLCDMTTA